MTPSLRLPLRSDKLKFFRAARGYADKAEVDYEEVCEEIGAFLFENEFEGDFLRDLDSATRTWWNGLKGKFKEAFGAVGGTEGADAHDAVRELMKAFEEGRGVNSEEGTEGTAGTSVTEEERTESGNTSGGFSGENGRGNVYLSGNGMGTRSAFEEGERWSAPPPIQWTGGVPESEKSLSETVAGIERNNSVKVSGTISENVRSKLSGWYKFHGSKARRDLASAILSEVENPRATLSDGRRFELTSKGLSEALDHATKLREGRFLDAAVELMKNAATFMEGAEEFYRETKNGETHCNFGGVVTFGGTEYYTVFTCVERPEGLRLKSVNSFKKETGTPPPFQAATPKRASRTMGGVPDVGDALRWIVENQDKSVEDFNSWRDGNRARLEEAEARKRQSERQSRVRPGVGLDVSRNGMNERKGNADIRWSIRRKEQEAWNAVLDAYEAGTLPQRGMNVVLGRTPVVLQRCGAEDLPIKISKSVLDKVVSEKHGISVSELRKLLTNIDDLIAVFRSRTQENSLVVLTEIIDEKNGDNAIVAIRLDAKESGGGHEINAVSSIYGRPSGQIEGFMRDGLSLYVNQKKSRAYLRSKRLQLPPEASKRGNLSLLTEEDFSDDALGEIKVNPESFGERSLGVIVPRTRMSRS